MVCNRCQHMVILHVVWILFRILNLPYIYCQPSTKSTTNNEQLPNIVIFIVDDLGWNQVGYHANAVQNFEIQTPNIDTAVANGIELNRGYMTPWLVFCF